MFKELLIGLCASSLISSGSANITSPYLAVNQFVIFNNISEIDLQLYNPIANRGQYNFYAEINTDEESVQLLSDNKGLYFEVNGAYSYYLKDFDDNFITYDTSQYINWTDYFYAGNLGLDFEELRNEYYNAWVHSINFENLFYWFQSLDAYDIDIAEFGYNVDNYIPIHTDWNVAPFYVDNNDFIRMFDMFNFTYNVSIGLNNYTYSPYANYNFEFQGNGLGTIMGLGSDIIFNGDYSFHTDNAFTSKSNIVITFSNISNLNYFRQYVFDDYPFYDLLQTYLDDSVDIGLLEQENATLKAQVSALQEQVDNLLAGNDFQVLIWTIAGTPWESFKHIWNVDILGINISGFITGLITALIIVWVVKKLFK